MSARRGLGGFGGRGSVALGALCLTASGCGLKLGEPRLLWLLWLVPALGAFFAYSIARRQSLAQRLVSASLLARLTPGLSPARLWLKAVLVLVAVGALALALTEPKYGFTWENEKRRGFDLVIALDLSDSMLAMDDGSVSRLTHAKRKITDLLGLLAAERVALVAFAGAAFIECPLTLDLGAVQAFVDELDTDAISAKGTNLGDALRVSLRALAGGATESGAILLITDGEDTTGDARAVADEAHNKGVRIFTIGVGHAEGAPIPGRDGSFRRDRRGELILSKLDEHTLEDIALETGGAYVRSVTGDVDVDALYQRIKAALAPHELEGGRRQRWHERYAWLVGLAWAALASEALLPERVRRRHA
jgi:Ca-activated chloride channel family protein